MIHILFILKIIGIVLLVILGILLALISIILFLPARYRLKADTDKGIEHLKIDAKLTWLFRSIYAYALYNDKKFEWQVRFFWKKLNDEEEEIKEDKKDDVEALNTDKKEKEKVKELTQKDLKTEEKKGILEKIKCTIREFCDKIKKLWKTKQILTAFFTDQTHIAAFRKIKNEFFVLLKHVKPRKMKGYVRFGLEDPYNTGRVLAFLSTLYPIYGERIQIQPEFEEEVLEGDLYIRGRVHGVTILVLMCKLFFDENVRKTHQDFSNIKL